MLAVISLLRESKYWLLLSAMMLSALNTNTFAQHSVAREWNEALLNAIRKDFARPTVHARNLFQISAAMYDAWAAYDSVAIPYFLGDTIEGFICPFTGVNPAVDIQAAREEAISYAAYRMIKHRFQLSPGIGITYPAIDSMFAAMGYDSAYHSINYADTPAALGNYIAQQMIAFGLQDGSNEQGIYANTHYTPRNPPLAPTMPGNPYVIDPNLWQPLSLDLFIDQNGNIIPGSTPKFLSPEWGDVIPFSLRHSQKTVYIRDTNQYNVYLDPGSPPLLDTANGGGLTAEYKWTFSLVAIWSSMLDPADSVMRDISPASIGNVQSYPTSIPDQRNFYDVFGGGDYGIGHQLNPKTGQPYTPQIVPRGDYARVLAEFWADGPNSETPPGHWFTILNYVNDHPQLQKKWRGQGPVLNDLEWDVKSYFVLGGAMHDVAITAWGIKGWYDYVRPISAIRYMCDQGQSSDSTLLNYSRNGIPLVPGYIEQVKPGEFLAGPGNQHAHKIKLRAWKGPSYVANPDTNVAGVDWILAENWWPYQRPTFITPPFAGYISGHSTYSRTAAEVLTAITGDEFFPGGMGEFQAPMNQYLVFEDGPSVDVTLQWATYRDASDQCSLSRIFGGIHPPADDIPGRHIGIQLGPQVIEFAEQYMDYRRPKVLMITPSTALITDADTGNSKFSLAIAYSKPMDTTIIPQVIFPVENPIGRTLAHISAINGWVDSATFVIGYDVADSSETLKNIDVKVSGARDKNGNIQIEFSDANKFSIDTENPNLISVTANVDTITNINIGSATFKLEMIFDENMDTSFKPAAIFPVENPLANVLSYNMSYSHWVDQTTFSAAYDVAYFLETLLNIDIEVDVCEDIAGNELLPFFVADKFSIDIQDTTVGINIASKPTIKIYPNPLTDQQILTITLNDPISDLRLELVNCQGKSLITRILNQQVNAVNLSPGMPAGIYFVRLIGNSSEWSSKIHLLKQ